MGCSALSGDDRQDCGLRGYNGGFPAIKGRWKDYVNVIHAVDQRLRLLVTKVQHTET